MKKQRGIRYAVIAAFLAASAVSEAALAVDEVESNGPIISAQQLTIGSDGTVSVNAVMGKLEGTSGGPIGDVDYFSFEGKEGDKITIDIDGGMKSVVRPFVGVDTLLALFGPAPDYLILHQKNDALAPVDPGSLNLWDARLDVIVLPKTGRYTVGVSSQPRSFRDGGTLVPSTAGMLNSLSNGSYTLTISGVTPAMLQVNIEIKPGSRAIAPVNPKLRGKIPVALLSQSDFRPLDVDRASLRYGATGDEATLSHCNKEGRDVNGDSVADLVCHFENEYANFDEESSEGVLKGKIGGKSFEGRGFLKVVPSFHRGD